jgi:hypothetical protein
MNEYGIIDTRQLPKPIRSKGHIEEIKAILLKGIERKKAHQAQVAEIDDWMEWRANAAHYYGVVLEGNIKNDAFELYGYRAGNGYQYANLGWYSIAEITEMAIACGYTPHAPYYMCGQDHLEFRIPTTPEDIGWMNYP